MTAQPQTRSWTYEDLFDLPDDGRRYEIIEGVLYEMPSPNMEHGELIMNLIELAADFAVEVLKPGGAFVTKAFQGGETAGVIALLKKHFAEVRMVKPKASRAESSEVYFVATGFRGR